MEKREQRRRKAGRGGESQAGASLCGTLQVVGRNLDCYYQCIGKPLGTFKLGNYKVCDVYSPLGRSLSNSRKLSEMISY